MRVLDATTIAFPSYDGNGMYYSMGNLSANPEVGCLFIDFERPFRMRLQGRAELVKSGPLMAQFKEAELVVQVAVSDVWMNCRAMCIAIRRWRRRAMLQSRVPKRLFASGSASTVCRMCCGPHETAAVAKAGTITIDEWMGRVLTGDEKA